MRKTGLFLVALMFALSVFLPTGAVSANSNGEVVVANRASGSISIIDVGTNQLLDTVPLPAAENPPEPMYVVYVKKGDHVFVGDRANDRVVVFDADDYSVVTSIPTGNGVFHMWADDRGRFLWVNNDGDKTATVIDPETLSVITTVPMPTDLVADGYFPHDVILDPKGRFAYVTMLGGSGPSDYLVQYSTETFEEVNRVEAGNDPHVSLAKNNKLIFVPAQGSDTGFVFNRNSLELVDEIAVPGAHGAWMSPNGQVFYTSNLPGGGTDGLFAIDTKKGAILGSADTPYAVPHNIVVTKNKTLFLTHSGGTADKVSIYSVSINDPIPVLIDEVTVGLNPFGLAYVTK
jgi:YVTN family beta-propeller protein